MISFDTSGYLSDIDASIFDSKIKWKRNLKADWNLNIHFIKESNKQQISEMNQKWL